MFKVGGSIHHPLKLEWGNGKVKYLDDKIIIISFECSGEKTLRYNEASVKLVEGRFAEPKDLEKKYKDFLNPILGIYVPKYAEIKDDFSDEILSIKRSDKKNIQNWSEVTFDILNRKEYSEALNDSVICVIPSSDKDKIDSGISMFAKALLLNFKNNKNSKFTFRDGIHLLKRLESLPKNSTSGQKNRASIDDHKRTICLEDVNLIKNQTVVLVDDISTTGNSMHACKQILLKSGARNVILMPLAKTARIIKTNGKYGYTKDKNLKDKKLFYEMKIRNFGKCYEKL